MREKIEEIKNLESAPKVIKNLYSKEETEEFLKTNSMIMVKNSQTLKHVFERLLKSKQRRELFGNNALKLLQSKKSVMNKYLSHFKNYL